jgi:hypothetical protein
VAMRVYRESRERRRCLREAHRYDASPHFVRLA